MSRTSPSVARVVAVINFFAEHPGQAFTLTDIVRSLRLSRATCHALLAALVEAGYLYRAIDKSYMLGPTLAAIGRAADSSLSPLQVAQPEMRALADKYDAVCSAVFREGNDVVVRERASSVSHLGFSVPRGMRLALRPPFAGIYFAWSKPEVVDEWLDQLEPPISEKRRQQMYDGIRFTREHGYSFGIKQVPLADSEIDTNWLFHDEPRPPIVLATEVHADEVYSPGGIQAPVFDARGNVVFVLALVGMSEPISGIEVEHRGMHLRQVCDRITSFIGGHQPRI